MRHADCRSRWMGLLPRPRSEEGSLPFGILYVAFARFALFMNTYGFKAMPSFSKFMIGYINLGSLYVFITLLVRTHPKPSANEVFVDVVNETGWSSKGVVFFLSLLPGVTVINGFDSAAHLADELPNPKKQVPQVMVGTVLLCAFAALPMVIVFLFSITNPESLVTATRLIFQLFKNSFDSMSLTTIACTIYLGLFPFACGSILTTLSRCWWAFAQTGALPIPHWHNSVSESWLLPLNAIFVVVALEILVGLLILDPATVLTGLVGSAAICFYVSYAMPIMCLLVKGRQSLPPHRYLDLGRFGLPINVLGLLWACVVSVFLSFPSLVPVTTNLMKYASAVVAVGMTVWTLNWIFYARKNYVSPTKLVGI